ncbi:hypothetical protein GWK36_11495 [Caldichromatium japonicum]|uniref:Uncharacterized protein n=1 Tax=Caldichromatium japonicum TaxID=2699430 RepID=A0A6G7VEV2_9GAMM|nr:hypothetical protein [Caldichromatium japonicum]QIK38504.1 hypothetical protein GWK36_11495 [Caldichromatium japonicum]
MGFFLGLYEAVRQIQEPLPPRRLVIVPAERSVSVARQRLKLCPVELAMPSWVIEREHQARPVQRHKTPTGANLQGIGVGFRTIKRLD